VKANVTNTSFASKCNTLRTYIQHTNSTTTQTQHNSFPSVLRVCFIAIVLPHQHGITHSVEDNRDESKENVHSLFTQKNLSLNDLFLQLNHTNPTVKKGKHLIATFVASGLTKTPHFSSFLICFL